MTVEIDEVHAQIEQPREEVTQVSSQNTPTSSPSPNMQERERSLRASLRRQSRRRFRTIAT